MPTENMTTPPAPFVLVGDSIQHSMNRLIPRHRPNIFKSAIEELGHVVKAIRAQTDTRLRTTTTLHIGNKWWGSEQFLVEYIITLGATVSPEVIDLIDVARPNTNKLPKWAEEPRLLQTELERIAAWENFFRLNEKMRVDENWQRWFQTCSSGFDSTSNNCSIVEALASNEWGLGIDRVDRAGVTSLIRMSNRWGQSLTAFFSRNHYIPGGDGSYHDTTVHPKKLRTVPYNKYMAMFPVVMRTGRTSRTSQTVQAQESLRTRRISRETVVGTFDLPNQPSPAQLRMDTDLLSIMEGETV